MRYLSGEMSVCKWVKKFIESLLVEFLIVCFLNFFGAPHLQQAKDYSSAGHCLQAHADMAHEQSNNTSLEENFSRKE